MVGFKIHNRNEQVGLLVYVDGQDNPKNMFVADQLQEWEVEHILRFFAYIRDVSEEELLESLPEFSAGFHKNTDGEFYEWIRDNPICRNADFPPLKRGEEILTTVDANDIWRLRRKDKFKEGDTVVCVDEYSHLRGLYGVITEITPFDSRAKQLLNTNKEEFEYTVHWKGTSIEGEEIDDEYYAIREEIDFPY